MLVNGDGYLKSRLEDIHSSNFNGLIYRTWENFGVGKN